MIKIAQTAYRVSLSCVALTLLACSQEPKIELIRNTANSITYPSFTDTNLETYISQLRIQIDRGENALSALGNLAMTFHANGFEKLAAELYFRLASLDADNPRWNYLLATIYAGYGQANQAIPLFEKVVRSAPDYLPARINQGTALYKSGEYEKAALEFKAALKIDPNEQYAQLGIGRIAVDQKDWENAKKRLEKATDLPAAKSLLVTTYEKLGDLEKATLSADDQAIPLGIPDPWKESIFDFCFDSYRISVLVAEKLERGDSAGIEKLLVRAESFDTENALLQRQLGDLNITKRNFVAARRNLEKAVSINRNDSENWLALLRLEKASNNQNGIAYAVQQGLAANPNSASLLREKGKLLSNTGDYSSAKSYFQKSIEIMPTHAETYLDLVITNFQLGNVEAAKNALEEGLTRIPNNPVLLSIYTRTIIDSGDKKHAIELLKKLVAHPSVEESTKQELIAFFRNQFPSESETK